MAVQARAADLVAFDQGDAKPGARRTAPLRTHRTAVTITSK
jgi:hypothetical protein